MTTTHQRSKHERNQIDRKISTGNDLPRTLDAERSPSQLALQQALANPAHATPRDILDLQNTYGNHAVSGLIQTKLRVGPVGDAYEQEADRVADQVMRMPMSGTIESVQRQELEEEELQMKPLAATITPVVQRQELEEEELLQGKPRVQRQEMEEEELLQGKPLVQRQGLEEEELLQGKPLAQRQELEEEELLQGKPLAQRQELEEEELQMKPLGRSGFQADADIEQRVASSKGSGSPLPEHLRADMEARFGNDFGAVRVHTGGEAEQLNRNLSARAFTHGSDIYMGSSQYNPDSTEGQRLLAHELTHVVQQTGHRKPRTDNAHTSPVQTQTVQRESVIQRDTVDNNWTDLLPKEKQALLILGFDAQGARQIPNPNPRARQRQIQQTWNGLTRDQRVPIFQQAQTQLQQTQALKGLGKEGGNVSGLQVWGDFDAKYHQMLQNAGISQGNIAQKLAEAQDLVQRYNAWEHVDEKAKAELGEKFGIATPEDFAKVPRGRAEEVQKALDDAKQRKTAETKAQEEAQKEQTARQEQRDLTKHPGFGEMAYEGWARLGTSIKRGTRSLLGLGMSSNTAKRRVYARRRQELLKAKLARGEMPSRQHPMRARPAPSVSGPSSGDMKNIMEAVKAIEGTNIDNKAAIIRALLAQAGM